MARTAVHITSFWPAFRQRSLSLSLSLAGDSDILRLNHACLVLAVARLRIFPLVFVCVLGSADAAALLQPLSCTHNALLLLLHKLMLGPCRLLGRLGARQPLVPLCLLLGGETALCFLW